MIRCTKIECLVLNCLEKTNSEFLACIQLQGLNIAYYLSSPCGYNACVINIKKSIFL